MRYKINRPSVAFEVVATESILIDLKTGDYFNVNSTGTWALQKIEQGATATQLLNSFALKDPPELERALNDFLSQLCEHDLVVSDSEGEADLHLELAPFEGNYEPPSVERFTDLQEFWLIDPVHEVDDRGWPNQKVPTPKKESSD